MINELTPMQEGQLWLLGRIIALWQNYHTDLNDPGTAMLRTAYNATLDECRQLGVGDAALAFAISCQDVPR